MLIETLRADLLDARKARDPVKVPLLTALVGEAAMVGKNAVPPRETTDDEAVSVVKKFIKNNTDMASALSSRHGTEPAPSEPEILCQQERAILEAYLPQQMTEIDIRGFVTVFTTQNPKASMGDIMSALKTQHAGRYDGKLASTVVKDMLK